MKLSNYVNGQWSEGAGPGEPLIDPVTGDELASISSQGVNLEAALAFARTNGGPALRQLSYAQRAELLAKISEALAANRDEYFRLSLLNLGANQADASFDVDGAIYTVKYYAKIGRALAEGKMLKEGALVPLSKSNAFVGQHFLMPTKGAAVFINAFNFPAWGLCEKAAPALLSGVPIVVKPASPTAWLTHRMVEDIVKADILPPGAISIICGGARDLLGHVREEDIVSFTGSGDTAARIRSHANVRRLLVPRQQLKAFGDAVTARLSSMKVGNPRNPEVKVGPVVNKAQQSSCLEELAKLKEECDVLFGGDKNFQPIDADPQSSAFVQPALLCCENGLDAKYVHDVEVFGPVATLVAYDSLEDLVAITRRGLGSLVASVFSNDAKVIRDTVLGIGDLHGRVLVVDSTVGSQHTGHGNVVPSCLHGGPGRSGGGEELAGLRALLLYHRRFVVQGPANCIRQLSGLCADTALLYS